MRFVWGEWRHCPSDGRDVITFWDRSEQPRLVLRVFLDGICWEAGVRVGALCSAHMPLLRPCHCGHREGILPLSLSLSLSLILSLALYVYHPRGLTLTVCADTFQGVPLGLLFGSIPFLLQEHAAAAAASASASGVASSEGGSANTYAEIGAFSLATYPYALKLLWAPLVDHYFFPSVGSSVKMQLTCRTHSFARALFFALFSCRLDVGDRG